MTSRTTAGRDTHRPVLGLLMGLRRPDQWSELVLTLGRWAEPIVADGAGEPPAAYLVSGPDVRGLDRAISTGRPVGVCAGSASALDLAVRLVVWTATAADAPGDPRLVILPSTTVERADASWPTTPFVRARWRAARGLPGDLVVDARDLDDDTRMTAFAVGSAVVATRIPDLLDAMAWAAPCVTVREKADAIGATAGHDVVVAEPNDLATEASRLGADHRRAAPLGRRGRHLVEARYDRTAIARVVADRLGLAGATPNRAGSILDAALADLRTPPGAAIRDRARVAVGGISPSRASEAIR